MEVVHCNGHPVCKVKESLQAIVIMTGYVVDVRLSNLLLP